MRYTWADHSIAQGLIDGEQIAASSWRSSLSVFKDRNGLKYAAPDIVKSSW